MDINGLSSKTRLKVLEGFESMLEDTAKNPKYRERANNLLEQVRESKTWLIDHYPAEEFLNDLPTPK